MRLEGCECDNFKFCFWQFLVILNECEKFYLNLSRCLPALQKNDCAQTDLLITDLDLDPAGLWIRIHFLRIRIQSLILEANTDTDPDPIRIQGFNDQKLKKNYS